MPVPTNDSDAGDDAAAEAPDAALDESEDGDETKRDDDDDRRPFVVGIGASAGGYEAMSALLSHIKLDSMAFVIVQHLAPEHESILPALLQKVTPAKVVSVVDGMKIEANTVYVIPPNTNLAVLKGALHLMGPEPADSPRAARQPIDYFFRTLAEDQGQRAIGVVLSGANSDGTFGLKAIKEAGGITFAQDPATARFDAMPKSAVDAGWADFVLAPEAIARELGNIHSHPYLSRRKTSSPRGQEAVAKLVVMMRSAFGTDFTYYKPSTIERRIERRMALHKIERIDDYVKFVANNPDELRLLYRDMLIGVTTFFRDTDPFEALKERVFPKIVEAKEPGGHIRVWVPACSTGEEAYSVAMALLEFLGDRASEFRIQIFGTDVDEHAIAHARRGCYPLNLALDVSPERLHQFFVKRDNEYQVSRRVRDMVVFSTQNVTRDAPFSRLDLVTCRNLLIYLMPAMQRKVLRILHYALNPSGFLMLGTSETVGDSSELFALVDRKSKVYAKKHVTTVAVPEFGVMAHADAQPPQPRTQPERAQPNLATVTDRKLLELFAPPGVVINDDLEVLHIRGRTGPYLDPTPGAPSFNILRLARPELHVDLRRAIHEAQTSNARVTVPCKIAEDGSTREFMLEVVPLSEQVKGAGRCMLVLFHTMAKAVAAPASSTDGPSGVDKRVEELERDLLVTKEYLQATIEELESGSEELKSSNEELQSANEELQSTNEELETSKEELQSANEELTTVNDELQNRMIELQQANDDLYNVLTGIGDAIVIVGMDLRIRRFTHAAERLLNLVPADIGRTANQLNVFIAGEAMEKVVADVIERLVPIEREVLCADEHWYLLRVNPYRTLDHSIKGAVIVLEDIDQKKRTASPSPAEFANSFLAAVVHPLALVDARAAMVWSNAAFARVFEHRRIGDIDKSGALEKVIGEVAAQNAGPARRVDVEFGGARYSVGVGRVQPIPSDGPLFLVSFESVPA